MYARRNELYQQSQEAWHRGDRRLAKELSLEAKEAERQAKHARDEHAAEIFERNNRERTDGMIDLHGLYVKEAEQQAERCMRTCERACSIFPK